MTTETQSEIITFTLLPISIPVTQPLDRSCFSLLVIASGMSYISMTLCTIQARWSVDAILASYFPGLEECYFCLLIIAYKRAKVTPKPVWESSRNALITPIGIGVSNVHACVFVCMCSCVSCVCMYACVCLG